MSTRPALERLLRPRSLAVVGASPEPGSIGGNLLSNLERFGWAGPLHLVSRSRAEIAGRPTVATLDDLPDGVDAVVLVVPSAAVGEAVAACARRGVGGVVVFASGFGELGEAGARAQDEIARAAREAGIALLGPNCLGLVNLVDGVPLTFEPIEPVPFPGSGVCVIAQSGAMAGNIRQALSGRGVPVAYTASTGNEAVLDAEDLLDGLLDDPAVGVFALFVEQLRRPRDFLALARRAREAGKPIVLMHPGRSARSREAAMSHTGALVGDHAAMRACAAEEAVVLVETLDELFDVTTLLARTPAPVPLGAAVMTNSGAIRGFALDFCEEIGLALPALADGTEAALRETLPSFATIDNPLDITAQGMQKPSIFGDSAAALLKDPSVGSLLVAAMGGSPAQQMAKWRSMRPVLEASPKPVALTYLGDAIPLDPAFLGEVRESGLPFFRSPERALRALKRLSAYGAALARLARPAALPEVAPASLPHAGPIAEHRGKALLAAAGIPVPEGRLAADLADAKAVAREIGYPVVLKAQAAALAHKSDVGGVAVGIAGEAELAVAWARLTEGVARARPGLVLDGVLVETMAPAGGLELILGARRDPGWGPVLMVGLGGVWAEALGDVALLPAAVGPERIAEELRRLKGARLLEGYRGEAPRDIAAAAEAAARIAALMRATPELEEIDVNPLVVYPEGEGVLALDALLVARGEST